MTTLTIPQLSLNLPSTRVSVDFANFSTGPITSSAPDSKGKSSRPSANKDLPPLIESRTESYPTPLSSVKEDFDTSKAFPSRQGSVRWRWKKPKPGSNGTGQYPLQLSRTDSTASTATDSSAGMSSIFSRSASTSTAHTSLSTSQPSRNMPDNLPEQRPTLLSLPLSLLENITSYVLDMPQTVVLGPVSTGYRHMQHRYHREGLNHLQLREFLDNPVFLVCQRLRAVSLDVFYRKGMFTVDLASIYYTKVSSTVDENLKKHIRFWNDAPEMVKRALRVLSRLELRLPVPSTEAGVRRGREEDDWMDGSDGKGGGGWRVKSMKREQADALDIQKCLDTITNLVLIKHTPSPEPQGLVRSFSTLSRSRSRSETNLRLLRSKSAQSSRSGQTSSPSPEDEQDDTRKPLKRLEIVLVKRNSQALILSESLGLIRIIRPIPVSGFTYYFFELSGQKFTWATKYRRRWQGMEPDGPRLLEDLQGLNVAEPLVEPICTPTQFAFVDVDKKGKLKLLDSALPKTPIVFEPPTRIENDRCIVLPVDTMEKSIRRKPVAPPAVTKTLHNRNDSFGFILEQGTKKDVPTKARNVFRPHRRPEPPTIDELRKIADDIRKGMY
ncbi:hypothetical protein K491DRAFT_717336 [Lophiostoma macrostomum CBS 122681]|uniref:Uncharacterized protein n=1 Tax=Lophiostoma macrostomum CBS 122681 TaxID=1314788 RepID=A0A6A6T3P8_9PLEO|nr:hypothetical protein K491DRAFT_717336 [Lophiostoma macrostomum CBS 122681]